jgi:Zn-dependent M28 family amino/carboxypeptidase
LSQYRFAKTLLYAPLAGEEQGLFGGRQLAERARREGWIIEGVLNNDIIGNISGQDGIIDNTRFRVFSEPTPQTETERERVRRRSTGGEVDGVSRQLARYVNRIATLYLPNIEAVMIYRLDRFGRGGDHREFNDLGFPAVRLTEMHENYTRQHQDIRTEDGIDYGDVPDAVDFDYAARIVAVNVATMGSLAWAPPPPDSVRISGAMRPSTSLRWSGEATEGYRVYWRETTAPQWTHDRWVGDTNAVTLENIVIDNYLFGVAAVGPKGNESVVVFPTSGRQ